MHRQAPFFGLLIPFAVGIIFALKIEINFAPYSYLALLISLFVLATVLHYAKVGWYFRWMFGFVVGAFMLVSGIALTEMVAKESFLSDGDEQKVIVRVLDNPEIRLSSTRVPAMVLMVEDDQVWHFVKERTLLYFSLSDTAAHSLKYGELLALKTSFSSPPKALNPYQFDYRDYLKSKGVFRVGFVKDKEWIQVGSSPHWLFTIAFNLRQNLLTLFQRTGITGENLAVLSALTMGYKSLLDQETRRVFSASGAMHILAVSGLHVGILFSTLSAFLFFLNRKKRGRLIKGALLIAFLFFFAVFTGLSPSVLRATLMFSLVIVGTSINHNSSVYNTLSASAFIILVANPMLIAEVGFQLSYMAVLSIVFFYPYIYKIFYIKNKWIDKIWVLISVSLAAQLGTFVLGIFYFNQFPNYFLLTNLYAIPLAFLTLYLAVALVILCPLPFAAEGVGWVLNNTLSSLNYLIRFTENLPHSTMVGISLSLSQAITLILAIVFLALFLEYKRVVFTHLILFLLLVFFAERAYQSTIQSKKSELIVFANRNSSLLGFRHGHSVILTTSDTTQNIAISDFSFAIDGYLNRLGARKRVDVFNLQNHSLQDVFRHGGIQTKFNSLGFWFSFKEKIILLGTGVDLQNYVTHTPLLIDVLVITSATARNISNVLNLVKPKVVVIDETVPVWQYKNIRETLNQYSLKAHFVKEDGAFIM